MSSAASALQSGAAAESIVIVRPLAEHRRHAIRPRLSVVPERVVEPAPAPNPEDVRRVLSAVLEVLDGRRPRNQLAALVPASWERLLAVGIVPGNRILKSVHLSRTTPTVVDLCARFENQNRSRAMAGRLELRADRWEFTVLAVV